MKGPATTYRTSVDGTADDWNEARALGITTVESNTIAGIPKRTNRYHPNSTRHSTIRRSKRRTPSVPSVAPVMINAERVGPSTKATMFE
jgi:hypothetical protein